MTKHILIVFMKHNTSSINTETIYWGDITSFNISPSGGDLLIKLNLSYYSNNGGAGSAIRIKIDESYYAPSESGIKAHVNPTYHDQYSFDWALSNVPAGNYTAHIQWKVRSGNELIMDHNDFLTAVIVELKK